MKRPAAFEVSPARVRVRRGPRSDGRWYWRADKPDGKGGRIDVWLGWGTKDEAAAEVRARLDERQPEPEPESEIETIGDLLDCWLGSIQLDRPDPSDRTRLAIEGAVKRLLAHGIADLRVTSFGREGLAIHVRAATAAKVASSTITRDLKYLRQAWRWGQELIPTPVPLRHLPRMRVEDTGPVYTRYTPTAEEVRGLLDGVSPGVRRALIIIAVTGCRISEAITLLWDRVTLDCSAMVVDGKTGERLVSVHSVVAAEMRRWRRGDPGTTVVGVTGQRVRVALARRSRELGIPRCSPNSLPRHVVDALYESAGPDPAAAGKQLGHSEQTALGHYRQIRRGRQDAVVEGAELGVVLAFREDDDNQEVG